MPINLTWGPIATIPANIDLPSPALTIDAPDITAQATADFSAQPSGISYTIRAEYRKTTGDAWRALAESGGTTIGGPARDRQGNIVESGIRMSPIPDQGTVGRQVRVVARVTATMTNVSGHAVTS